MLSKKGEYVDPVFVNDYAPTSHYLYFKELVLTLNCELYSYAHGNNLGFIVACLYVGLKVSRQALLGMVQSSPVNL